MTQRDTAGTAAFLRAQHGHYYWPGLCLKLQRTARNIPSMFPSAISAQQGTPARYRVSSLTNVKRGMVAYFDNPNDSNPYGHITFVAGRNKHGELMHWTNDVPSSGAVSLVKHSYFSQYWGDQFQFAATWLNGVELDLPESKHSQPPLESGGARIQRAIKILQESAASHRKKGHNRLVKALERDIAHLKEILKTYGGLE